MRETFRWAVLNGILMLAATLGCVAQKASTPPAAPVPVLITSAKKIFIANMGADNFSQNAFKKLQDPARPYNAFYAEMKNWNRYEIVDSPNDAELIFEIGFSAPIVQEGFEHGDVWAGVQPGHRGCQNARPLVDSGRTGGWRLSQSHL
jgi:hypothetical protein